MIAHLRKILTRSIQAKFIAVTGAIVLGVVCVLTFVIALMAASILKQESSRQLSQSLEQSAALLSNFLDVRETNMDLWANSPLVEAMFDDPALAAVFLPGLQTYFSKIREQEPWIYDIFLIRDQSVVYDDSGNFAFLDDSKDVHGGFANLLSLPVTGVSPLNLKSFNSRQDRSVLLFKRPIVKDGRPIPGAFIVLVLDFGKINEKLFGQIQVEKHGFISILAKERSGAVITPSQTGSRTEERNNFLEASKQWHDFRDIPEHYQNIIFKQQEIPERPFAIVGVASSNDIREPVLTLIYFSGFLGFFALVAGIWSAIFFSGRLIGPIRKLTDTAEQLTRDHLHADSERDLVQNAFTEEDQGESHDELASLANSFTRMKYAIQEKIDVIETQNEQLRKSDLLKEELNQSLEQKVRERTLQLQDALHFQQEFTAELNITKERAEAERARAETASQMKSDFIAMISHEVRTPLGGVIGMLRFGLKDANLGADTRAKLVVGLSNAEMLLQIINDILDYSKLAAGKMALEVIDFELLAVVRDTVAILNDRAEAKGISLVFDIADDLPAWCRGDPTRLRQILVNLIGNAIKFTEKGDVRISVFRHDEHIGFAIRDSGIGIATEAIPRLFKKFEQADTSTSRKFGGTGLGLAICKHIVRAMGGAIEVKSEFGTGSTFTFHVPLPPGHEVSAVDIDSIKKPHAYHLDILCAEDGATNQIIIRELVQTMGHHIDIVEDGISALEALAVRDYDLVLMDSRMPRMDGIEALQIIRLGAEGVRDASIPVVALTANVSIEERERFFAAGVNGFLSKPLDEVALHNEIGKMISLLIERNKSLVFPPNDSSSSISTPTTPDADPLRGFNEDSMRSMMRIFSEQAPLLLATVRTGLKTNDGSRIALAAHTLRGSAGYFNAEELRSICHQIETAADAADFAAVSNFMDAFEKAILAAIAQLEVASKQ